MTSKIKVDNINKVSDDSNIINKCGTAINVGASGNTVTVTGNDIRSDSYKAADGGVIASQSGTTITLGASGDTITLASGASQTGFGRTGTVDWDTTPKTSTFTGVSGNGYFINSGSSLTCNLPAGSPGDIIAFSDYARNFATYNFILDADGSEKIGGITYNAVLDANGQVATFVYVDATKGWVNVENSPDTETGLPPFVVATGGDATVTCGDYKTHIFTTPGTFTVSNVAPGPSGNPNVADYLVVAGGGGASSSYAGGGGAGGFRMSNTHSLPAPETSPLANPSGITLAATPYTITVGGGGAGASTGANGDPSTFATITSAGGGYSSGYPTPSAANPGGSGGAGRSIGTGNDPPTSPPQGNDGGSSPPGINAQGGGGGAGAAGGAGGPSNTVPGPGGIGSYISNSFVGPTAPSYGETGPVTPTRYFAGGGGGGSDVAQPTDTGGIGGGGSGRNASPATDRAGAENMGGGAGGTPGGGENGGSGIIMIRYKYQ